MAFGYGIVKDSTPIKDTIKYSIIAENSWSSRIARRYKVSRCNLDQGNSPSFLKIRPVMTPSSKWADMLKQ